MCSCYAKFLPDMQSDLLSGGGGPQLGTMNPNRQWMLSGTWNMSHIPYFTQEGHHSQFCLGEYVYKST